MDKVKTGLEHWADVLSVDDIDDQAIARVEQSPELRRSLRYAFSSALSLYDSDPVLHRNVKDIGRFVLGVVALYMDASGGLTHRRLRTISGEAGVASAGRATAILWQLRRIGYVQPANDAQSGRSHRYVPTEQMRMAFRARFRIEFEALALIDPAIKIVLTRFDEPRFADALWTELGRKALSAVATPFHREQAINEFSQRDAGMLVLFALMDGVDPADGEVLPVGRTVFSISALSQRFGVSRTHVRRLLKELEKAEYFRMGNSDGVGYVEPLLRQVLERYYTINYVGLAACAHLAAVACAEEPEVAVA